MIHEILHAVGLCPDSPAFQMCHSLLAEWHFYFNQLKSLFAALLISVAIAIAYDSFFREKSQLINTEQVIQTDLSKYAEFSLKLSNEFPFLLV